MPLQLAPIIEQLDAEIHADPRITPELFERLTVKQHELGLLHGTRPTCPFLRPHIVARSQYERVASAAQILAGAFERLVLRALEDESLLNELGLTKREKLMAMVDPGYEHLCVTSRLDAFLTDDGFKFLEYNAESPAGLADQLQLEKILFSLPHMQEFLSCYRHWTPKPHRRLLEVLVETYRAWGGTVEKPQIGIIDWAGVSTESEFYVLKDFFESEGYATAIADPRALFFDGEALSAGDFRIDILYKRVVIHEFLEKFDETHPMSRAYIEGKVCMVNSFRTKAAHKKAGFAILSDSLYENLFTPEQRECIHQHVPWTRHVREGVTTFAGEQRDLLDLLREERERLVLKPNDDYGGHGIYIGWETDEENWEKAIAHALSQSYVVQERVPVRKISVPMFTDRLEQCEMLVDFDPFLFLNRVEGGLVRLSASSLANVSSGAGETALLVVEDF